MPLASSQRLIIRTLEAADIDAVMRFWGDAEVMRYVPGPLLDRATILKAIDQYHALHTARGYAVYAVVLKTGGTVIGACGFNPTASEDEVELIFHFAKEHWGKGYATEAGELCIQYIRHHPKIKTITASLLPENTASEQVLQKLGFQYTGTKWQEDSQRNEPCYTLRLADQ